METGADNGWDRAVSRYEQVGAPIAEFNVELLGCLQPRWATKVQVVTSMFRLWFVRPGSSFPFDERVVVEWESSDRVRAELVREIPRQALTRPGGSTLVSGDYAKPADVVPVVEALLLQLAGIDGE